MFRHHALFTFGLALIVAAVAIPVSAGGNERVLYSFGPKTSNGWDPVSSLILDSAGNLYGTTAFGGNSVACNSLACGTVFELSPGTDGNWRETVLYSFNASDGAFPSAPLIFDEAGNLYGTTWTGGANYNRHCYGGYGCGAVFELSPGADGAWTEKVLYSFCSIGEKCLDGLEPEGSLALDAAGNLYGTVAGGGANFEGAVFRLAPNADGTWTENLLYSFQDNGTDGTEPISGVILDNAGNLYGEAAYGIGCGLTGNGCGAVFELSPDGNGQWREKILYNFTHANRHHGSTPLGGLIFDVAGSLYGTTYWGGYHNDGTVFKLTPKANGEWAETVLHSFGTKRLPLGAGLNGVTFDAAGNLVGTTFQTDPGCSGRGEFGCGTIFELSPGSGGRWSYSLLFNFYPRHGWGPSGLVLDPSGNLYGITEKGGAYLGGCDSDGGGCGAVFEFTP
jgi:uncharacterized repeat protein (TIGR03803 family)